MAWIDSITKENYKEKFNLKYLLEESIFYPNSALDASDIEKFGPRISSYVHTDEVLSFDNVKEAMMTEFDKVGYDALFVTQIPVAGFRFALWAVYVLRPTAHHYSDGTRKARRFSLLHFSGNSRLAFTQLYEQNRIRPFDCFQNLSLWVWIIICYWRRKDSVPSILMICFLSINCPA